MGGGWPLRGRASKGEGPEGEGGEPRIVAPRGGLSGGARRVGGPNFRAFFPLFGVFSRNFGGV